MRIVCPACDATYEVPDATLRGGTRKVRCAKCSTEWIPDTGVTRPRADLEFETPPVAIPAPPPEPVAAPLPDVDPHGRQEPRLKPLRHRPDAQFLAPPAEEFQQPPPRGGAKAVVAWALSLLLLAAAAGAAVTWRTQVMAAWPPSERVFVALGLR
jgi:predicted Zn finger-like uncharacterized protein